MANANMQALKGKGFENSYNYMTDHLKLSNHKTTQPGD